ncbi:MAG: MBL fold metallo-hydrolase [Caldilineaceae bacterium]|nr:MBL fold metallo-hydrolase [Caldilineaceae bacterium]
MIKLTYVGHATMLIEIDGVRILTDPILRGRVGHLRRAATASDPMLLEDVDVVLISHLHWDHFDPPSIRRLGNTPKLVGPTGTAKTLNRRPLRRTLYNEVQEINVGEVLQVGPLEIRSTYAEHKGSRYPIGPATESLGFVISSRENGGHSVYFAGDTDLFDDMQHVAQHLEHGLDVALLPVWGWGPTLGKGHMNPLRAAQSLRMLQPRLAIPIHWGTLHPIGMGSMGMSAHAVHGPGAERNKPRFLSHPPQAFVHHAVRIAPEVEVCVLPPGGHVAVERKAENVLFY